MSEVIASSAVTLTSTTATEDVPLWTAGSYNIGVQKRLDTTHRIYESLVDANSSMPPGPTWQDVGPANRYAVFDDSYRTQTTATSSLTFVITADAFTNRIALMNLTGTSLQVVVTKGATEVYNKTFSLLNSNGIVDLWTYFYNPFVYIRDKIVGDGEGGDDEIRTMAGLTYTVTITGPGTVGIGLIRIGLGKFIGKAEYGSGVGTTRYSQPLFDKYGNYTPSQKRPSAKRGSFNMHLDAALADDVKETLDGLDIGLVVFNMTETYTRGKIWGFVKSADFTFFTYGIEKYRLEIEGAT